MICFGSMVERMGHVGLRLALCLAASLTLMRSSAWAEPCSLADGLVNVSFTRFPENPIIEPSTDQYPNGFWTDNLHTLHQCVRRKDTNSPYMMWYTGDSSADHPRRIHIEHLPELRPVDPVR